MSLFIKSAGSAACLFLTACAGTAPLKEYSLARSAIDRAKFSKSDIFQSKYFEKANHYYKKAEKEYFKRNYANAEEAFAESRKYAEKAEELTRVQKSQKGEE